LPYIAEYLYKSILQGIVGVVAVVNYAVSNGEHGIAILLVEVALGNTVVAGATMHKFPLNIAFAGDQSYNVPQNSIGLSLSQK
jgi:hypothetical protein